MKSAAPSARARSARPCSSNPLNITTRVDGDTFSTSGNACNPSTPGIDTSSSINAGSCCSASATACAPSAPSPTTLKDPDTRSRVFISRRTSAASSTTTTVGISDTSRRYRTGNHPGGSRTDPASSAGGPALTPQG